MFTSLLHLMVHTLYHFMRTRIEDFWMLSDALVAIDAFIIFFNYTKKGEM